MIFTFTLAEVAVVVSFAVVSIIIILPLFQGSISSEQMKLLKKLMKIKNDVITVYHAEYYNKTLTQGNFS